MRSDWTKVDKLLEGALGVEPSRRADFLKEMCGGDDALRREVESLVAAHDQAGSFIENAPIDLAAEALAAAQPRLAPGQIIGRYKILRELGRGGMGEVYLAEDPELGRQVALKLLPESFAADEERVRRFRQEARAASALNHPNIITIHEIGRVEAFHFIITEFVDGETLASRISQGPLPVGECLAIGAQLAGALSEAHSAGIVHRDIKPQNIMINARGQVKVLDFGLAKIVPGPLSAGSEAATQSLLTEPGLIVGTVAYMSPEQLRGEALDARTDMFSFGSTLYEMITGRQPFASESTAETISAILTRDPVPLGECTGDASPALERVVLRCLVKDRRERYQKMGDVAIELERAPTRRERESDQDTPPIDNAVRAPKAAAVTRDAAAVNHRFAGGTLLHSRVAQAMMALMALAVAIFVYGRFLRNPRPVSTPGIKSVNSAAYDYYLRGRVNLNSQNPENNETAIKLLEQAVAADPSFAPAWADLARAYNVKASFFAPDPEKKQLYVNAEVDVEKALALDPDLAEGHSARGFVLWTPYKGFPHEQAIQCFQRALALNPNLDEAHHQLGMVYLHIGLLDKAWDEIEKTLAIRPDNTLARFRFGVINMYRARYEDALAVFKSVPRDANPSLRERNMVMALFQLGRDREAANMVEEFLKAYPKDEGGAITSVKAMLLAKSGKQSEAEKTIQSAIEIGRGYGHFHHTAYNIASAYAFLNKRKQAIEWLQNAADDGFPCYPFFEIDANLSSLRNDEDFQALMTRLRKQWESLSTFVSKFP
jgi:tetratricopeptide (TPR) repeat protein